MQVPALPTTLHGQLALLTYDQRHHRFDGERHYRYGLALRAAMLTDLFISGHLQDRDDRPHPVEVGRVEDAVLQAALDDVRRHGYADWPSAVVHHSHEWAPEIVHDQLSEIGWLQVELYRKLRLLPDFRVRPADLEAVAALSERTRDALRCAIDNRATDTRLLVVGLLGTLGQLPTVFPHREAKRGHTALYELTYFAPPPIAALLTIIGRARSDRDTAEHNGGG
ncbi:GOLPH3/VPS74 family protein [Mycobacterium sp. C31M]